MKNKATSLKEKSPRKSKLLNGTSSSNNGLPKGKKTNSDGLNNKLKLKPDQQHHPDGPGGNYKEY